MIGLTPRQNELLSFISKFAETHNGAMPTFREMSRGTGITSMDSVCRNIRGLEQRGAIRRLKQRPRAIELVGPSQRTVTINASLWPALSRYAASHKIPVDTAACELLRDALEAA
jgi:SOS-response transcriptional repressor LexA